MLYHEENLDAHASTSVPPPAVGTHLFYGQGGTGAPPAYPSGTVATATNVAALSTAHISTAVELGGAEGWGALPAHLAGMDSLGSQFAQGLAHHPHGVESSRSSLGACPVAFPPPTMPRSNWTSTWQQHATAPPPPPPPPAPPAPAVPGGVHDQPPFGDVSMWAGTMGLGSEWPMMPVLFQEVEELKEEIRRLKASQELPTITQVGAAPPAGLPSAPVHAPFVPPPGLSPMLVGSSGFLKDPLESGDLSSPASEDVLVEEEVQAHPLDVDANSGTSVGVHDTGVNQKGIDDHLLQEEMEKQVTMFLAGNMDDDDLFQDMDEQGSTSIGNADSISVGGSQWMAEEPGELIDEEAFDRGNRFMQKLLADDEVMKGDILKISHEALESFHRVMTELLQSLNNSGILATFEHLDKLLDGRVEEDCSAYFLYLCASDPRGRYRVVIPDVYLQPVLCFFDQTTIPRPGNLYHPDLYMKAWKDFARNRMKALDCNQPAGSSNLREETLAAQGLLNERSRMQHGTVGVEGGPPSL